MTQVGVCCAIIANMINTTPQPGATDNFDLSDSGVLSLLACDFPHPLHKYSPIPDISAMAPYPSRSEIAKPVMALVKAKQALRQGRLRRQVRRPGALLWTMTLLFGCLFLTVTAAMPQLSRIETEKLVMALVETELQARRAKGAYAGKFAALAHYFGYEGRCALPTNFDATCGTRQ